MGLSNSRSKIAVGNVSMGSSRSNLLSKAFLLLGSLILFVVLACGSAVTSTNPSPESELTQETPVGTGEPVVQSGSEAFPGSDADTTPSETPDSSVSVAGDQTLVKSTVEPPVEQPPEAPTEVPLVDKSIHSVPLEDIVFDTFGGSPRFLPLDQASDEVILGLRDLIRPILEPAYGVAGDLPWLDDDALVIGYSSENGAYAYPVNVLDFHEIVNDIIEGVPVLVTYCPLCFSGVVCSRTLDDRTLTFGNTSALYQSDLVMYDHQTGSYWFQVGGEAVVGLLTPARLDLLPSTTVSWGEWKSLYPETQLLTGFADSAMESAFADRRYGRGFSKGYQDRINDERFVFPVDEQKLDDRLPSGEIVLTVEVGGAAVAFPLGRIGDAAVNHNVGGQPVVLFVRKDNRASVAFSRDIGDRLLTFDYREADQSFVDRETGSIWDTAGRAISGLLAGSRLKRMDTRRSFWFSIAIAFPDIDLYLP